MSTQITTAFVNQFSANIQMLSQQMGSLLRDAVDVESVNGEKAFFDQVGSTAAVKKTSRHADQLHYQLVRKLHMDQLA